MDTSLLHCKDVLLEHLIKAKESLKGVDSNLRRFTSRPSLDNPARDGFYKNEPPPMDRWRHSKDESNWQSSDEANWYPRDEQNYKGNFKRQHPNDQGDNIENIPVKRRLGPKVLHSSLSGPPRKVEVDDFKVKKPTISSCVVAKPHVLPPRKEAVAVKTYKETRARDRRMFGALMGTLKKFRQEETQMKDKEDKKALVEQKLEEAAREEKRKIREERQKLMLFRKQKEEYIRTVENNMKLVKEHEHWESLQQPLFNYIQSETQPVLYYLPKVLNEKTAALLEQSKEKLKKMIEDRRSEVQQEVDSTISKYEDINIEELMGPGPEASNILGNRERSRNQRNHEESSDLPNNSTSENVIVKNCSLSSRIVIQRQQPKDLTKELLNKKSGSVSIKEEKVQPEEELDYEDDVLPVKKESVTHDIDFEDNCSNIEMTNDCRRSNGEGDNSSIKDDGIGQNGRLDVY